MNELILHVPGMTCGHCESSIKGALGKLPGIERVDVDLVSKDVTVSIADTATDRATIVATLDDIGFEVVG